MLGHLVFWWLMDKIGGAAKKEDELRRHPGYRKVRCPQCRGWVLPKELERRGCYLCGWKEGAVRRTPTPQRVRPSPSRGSAG